MIGWPPVPVDELGADVETVYRLRNEIVDVRVPLVLRHHLALPLVDQSLVDAEMVAEGLLALVIDLQIYE